jgi:DNA-binding response OmpR family regulator
MLIFNKKVWFLEMEIDSLTLQRMKRLSLLVVEDSASFRAHLCEILEEYFYRVESAMDGAEGLEKYQDRFSQNTPYDIVISDIRMPKMNGVELTARLRAIREDQPIIILSAHAETEYLIPLINVGISQFITKPIHYPQMFDTLQKVCGKINSVSAVSTTPAHHTLIGEYTYWDKEKKVLFQNETAVTLTKYEMVLMDIFTTKFEQICTSDEILSHFYNNGIDVSPDNLRGLLMRLRKKLPEKALSSIYGMGYRLSSIS